MNLRYNEISMKASHNSYESPVTPITAQLVWEDDANYNKGCGALELDVSKSAKSNNWSVGHNLSYRTPAEAQLSFYLEQLGTWSGDNPGHDVVTLHIDLKNMLSNKFYDDLDTYIKNHLRAPIFSPGALFGDENTLTEGVKKNGWPTLDELKGKFIICITGDVLSIGKNKKLYAGTSPKERLCFADKDRNANDMPDDPNRLFYNYHIYERTTSEWTATFRKCAEDNPHYIIRAYIANSGINWSNCLKSGVNIIATDEITGYNWAKVGKSRFEKRQTLQ